MIKEMRVLTFSTQNKLFLKKKKRTIMIMKLFFKKNSKK